MRQIATKVETVLYTLQPGDGTLYTFSIGCISQRERPTRIFETVNHAQPRNEYGLDDLYYQRITSMHELDHTQAELHFPGWERNELVYLVNIYSPSVACFSVSQDMLANIRTDHGYVIDYLRGTRQPVDRYTMYIVMACLEELNCLERIPSVDRMQRALISARTILESPAFKGDVE